MPRALFAVLCLCCLATGKVTGPNKKHGGSQDEDPTLRLARAVAAAVVPRAEQAAAPSATATGAHAANAASAANGALARLPWADDDDWRRRAHAATYDGVANVAATYDESNGSSVAI